MQNGAATCKAPGLTIRLHDSSGHNKGEADGRDSSYKPDIFKARRIYILSQAITAWLADHWVFWKPDDPTSCRRLVLPSLVAPSSVGRKRPGAGGLTGALA